MSDEAPPHGDGSDRVDPGPPPAGVAGQGLVLGRWVAGELLALRVEAFAWVAWVMGAIGLVCLGLSLPVDPGWPLIALGVVLVASALVVRLLLALAAAVVRRLALPHRARHLRPELAAARERVREAVGAAGVPVSLSAGAGFLWALARGRRPHRGVPGNLRALVGEIGSIAEVERLRTALAQAAPGRGAPAEPPLDAAWGPVPESPADGERPADGR